MSRTNEDTKRSMYNARGKHTGNQGFQPMNHWVVCDSCGFDIRASDIKETWDHRMVCPSDWEPRHPQDFVRSKQDHIRAESPVRPVPADIFIDVCFGTSGISGLAVSGCAISGDTSTITTIPSIPEGTFNPNTL